MLDIKFIKENLDLVKTNNASRGVQVDLDRLLTLVQEKNSLQREVDEWRAEKNKFSKQKPDPAIIEKMRELGKRISDHEARIRLLETEINNIIARIPNINQPDVPIGKDENDNVVIKEVGERTEFSFAPKAHWELGEELDLIDTKTAAQISGSRFSYLKNELVLLEFALLRYVLDKLLKYNFIPLLTPTLVKKEPMFGTGFLPTEESQIYRVNPEQDDLYLIGTSEVTLVSYFANQVIDVENPIRLCGFSTCFRREAGTYGKDTKGIIRQHQFDKLEMVSFTKPEDSRTEHDFLLSVEEEIWQDLKIPYRVLNICSGDLGASASKKYDIEAWLPSEQRFLEVTSCSNCTDFQARRLKIKFVKDKKTKELVHTLNGTAVAMGRTMLVIMENYQQADGSILMPEVLQPYLPFSKIERSAQN